MIIERKDNKHRIKFGHLLEGTTFSLDDNPTVYMKIRQDRWAKNKYGADETWINAVSLNDGATYHIRTDREIIPIMNIKLIIEED